MSDPILISGLDLGKVADFAALAVVARHKLDRPPGSAAGPHGRRKYRYELRWLEAWELGTPYTTDDPAKIAIVPAVKARFDHPSLSGTNLAVDQTGVGTAVVDIIRAAKIRAHLTPVVITAGHAVTEDRVTREAHVPKKELVSTLLVLLEAGLIRWAPAGTPRALALTPRLEKELTAFRVATTKAKNETFGAELSQHDDLVMALALAVWLGERCGSPDPAGIGAAADAASGASVTATAPAGVWVEGRERLGPNPDRFGG